jgi:hypothetical protein
LPIVPFAIGYKKTPPIPVKAPTHPRRGLDAVTEPALLKVRWKLMRRDLRKLRPTGFYLPYDALEWLPFEFELAERMAELRDDVLTGKYRAAPPETIRAAKSLGLTRPLAFLDPADVILYRNIVALAETDLLQEMQPWTRFGRKDGKEGDSNFDPDSGWFRAWLRRNAQLWTITEHYDWLVETDVSNFFPSIHLDAALDHLLAHSRLSVETIRLLSHMLSEFALVPEYRVSPLVGLPQDSFDCSRIIAHSFLGAVDDEFQAEGSTHRFSRYMDDIVIGANSHAEGQRYVSRAQTALEKIGLYPNTSKTRIVPRDQFAGEYMKQENDYLGDVDTAVRDGSPVDLAEFRQRLNKHIRRQDRPRGWERVLRRYYTLSRSLRVDRLLDVAFDHMEAFPGSTRSILDYCATYPLNVGRVTRLSAAVHASGLMYQDVRLLALEFLAVTPNRVDKRTSTAICEWASEVLDQEHEGPGRLAASAVVLLGKFGGTSELDLLQKHFEDDGKGAAIYRRQLLTVMVGAGRLDPKTIPTYAGESAGMAEACRFMSILLGGDKRALYMALDAIKPRERQQPRIYMIPSRGMFLVPPLEQAHPAAVKKARTAWQNLLQTSAPGLQDAAGRAWLGLPKAV